MRMKQITAYDKQNKRIHSDKKNITKIMAAQCCQEGIMKSEADNPEQLT